MSDGQCFSAKAQLWSKYTLRNVKKGNSANQYLAFSCPTTFIHFISKSWTVFNQQVREKLVTVNLSTVNLPSMHFKMQQHNHIYLALCVYVSKLQHGPPSVDYLGRPAISNRPVAEVQYITLAVS